ncbi:MAG: hypothetical protein K0R00_195 [Herbinix sp.]|jgi:hypothetical protein|nr:hypothetical protein [Herbinix sp.]
MELIMSYELNNKHPDLNTIIVGVLDDDGTISILNCMQDKKDSINLSKFLNLHGYEIEIRKRD